MSMCWGLLCIATALQCQSCLQPSQYMYCKRHLSMQDGLHQLRAGAGCQGPLLCAGGAGDAAGWHCPALPHRGLPCLALILPCPALRALHHGGTRYSLSGPAYSILHPACRPQPLICPASHLHLASTGRRSTRACPIPAPSSLPRRRRCWRSWATPPMRSRTRRRWAGSGVEERTLADLDKTSCAVVRLHPEPNISRCHPTIPVISNCPFPLCLPQKDCPEMSADAMMGAMNKGMAGRDLMPAGTDPAVAMGGYDLGELGPAPVKGIAFDSVRGCGQRRMKQGGVCGAGG